MTLLNIYNALMIIGIAMPLLSIITSFLDFDFDFDSDMEIDTDGIIPINTNSLFFGMLITGAVGRCIYTFGAASLVLSITIGLAGYIASYYLVIRPLKSKQIKPLNNNSLIGKTGNVITTIKVNEPGEVSLTDETGSVITYIARYQYDESEEQVDIQINTKVVIIKFENGELTVARYI